MPGVLTAFNCLFPQTLTDPAVAAAVIVIGSPAPQPLTRLGQALRAVAPHLSSVELAAWVAALMKPLRKAGVTSARGVAAFLGQCGVESAGFTTLEEDLAYTAVRLCQVWPSHFPNPEIADACALRPERLANRVYANRMGNGGETTGDGWRFRGRGLIQITGRTSYELFARAMNMPLDEAVAYAASQAGAADSAVWFWSTHQLNALANAWSVDLITRKINGGTEGAAERTRLSEAALHVLGV